jgi:adenine-specific DNA-methyltransferase
MSSEQPTREHVAPTSADIQANRIEQLRAVLPEVFTEGKLDFSKLREALGELPDERGERYTFSWAGRRDAQRLIQEQSRGTLFPAPNQSLDWDSTQNVFIEGENLEVLKLLYRAYYGRVKLIYIDPPYNTGNDFVYPDNYGDPLDTYLKLTGQKNGNGNLLTSNPETNGRHHSRWLSMMYPRLFVARQLLREDGVIFISIDDGEVANLKSLMNEIFGEENFVAHIVWQKRYVSNVTAQFLSDMHDHILVYGRQKANVKVRKIERTEEQLKDYKNPDNDDRGVWRAQDLSASKPYSAGMFTITSPAGLEFNPPPGRYWRCNRAQYEEWLADNRIWFGKEGTGRPMLKAFLTEVQEGITPNTWWSHEFAGHNKEATLEVKELFDGDSPFDTAKPVKLIRRMLELFADKDALVLDFFGGSSTTAHAVLDINREDGGNRRFIVAQFPEKTKNTTYATIADIGKERIRRVVKKLKDERNGQLDLNDREQPEDLGFRVYKYAPSHIKHWPGHTGDNAEEYVALALSFVDLLVEGWTPEGVLWEVALKEGLSLSSRVETVPGTDPNTVQRVTDADTGRFFFICLDDQIAPDLQDKLKPDATVLFVCRDSAIDETTHANLSLACRVKTL